MAHTIERRRVNNKRRQERGLAQEKRQWHTDDEKDAIVRAYREWKDSPWYRGKPTSRALADSLGISYGWMMSIVRERSQAKEAEHSISKLEAFESLITRLIMDNTKLSMTVEEQGRRIDELERRNN